jgi:hypothetical protein
MSSTTTHGAFMPGIKERIKNEVNELWIEGLEILKDEVQAKQGAASSKKKQKANNQTDKESKKLPLHMRYQTWYSKTLPVIRQLLPERYQEFQDQYKLEKRKEKEIDFLTYTISDYLIGLQVTRGVYKEEVVNPYNTFLAKFQHQLFILHSALERVESILSDIQGVLQSELFDGELRAAEDLAKKNHLRASGALAGVTLEIHLSKVAKNHKISFQKKSPTISDLNEAIKKADIIDVPTWRLLQRLGDIRNLCVHAKERDPTKDEIDDLIRGARKMIAELF